MAAGVVPFLVFVIVVAGLVLRGMSADERIEFAKRIPVLARRFKTIVTYIPPECRPFNDALRERTGRILVTPAIIGTHLVIFLGMLFGAGSFADRDTLLAWGASFGPRTTNGEWWRLFTCTFVNAGFVHLLASLAGTVRLALMLERLVGPVAFATTYVAAGVLASLASLAGHPVAVHVGPSGAIYGIYGLLMASLGWGLLERSPVTIPLAALKQIVPGMIVFLLYTWVVEGVVTPAMIAGIAVGSVCGVVLAGRVSASKPPMRRVLATLATTAGIIVVLAAPLRGVADVTGEIAQAVAVEDQTSRDYDAAADRFKRGRLKSDGLIEQIDHIQPVLQRLSVRLNSLENVPPEHRWLVDTAREYVRLRQESWRLRAQALQASDMRGLQKADAVAHTAIAALDKIRPVRLD